MTGNSNRNLQVTSASARVAKSNRVRTETIGSKAGTATSAVRLPASGAVAKCNCREVLIGKLSGQRVERDRSRAATVGPHLRLDCLLVRGWARDRNKHPIRAARVRHRQT